MYLAQQYRISQVPQDREGGPYDVVIVGYQYELEDSQGHEILAYHWHPEGRSQVTRPHLHLGYGARLGRSELQKAHLPTGHVSMGEVLRCLIDHFGVATLRKDWSKILDQT